MASGSRHAQLSYTEMFTADKLIVELDGVTYTLDNKGDGRYGASNTPNSKNHIGIVYENGINTIYIRNAFSSGDHHVVIKGESSSIETTECFKKAVRSVSSMVLKYFNGEIQGATWFEAYDALENGAMLFLNYMGDFIPCTTYGELFIAFDQIWVDASAGVTSYRVQWNSDGTVTTNTVIYPQPS